MNRVLTVIVALSFFAACGGDGGDGGGDPGQGGTGGVGAGGGEAGSGGTGGDPGTGGTGGTGGVGGTGGTGGTPASTNVTGVVVGEAGDPMAGVLVALDGNFADFRVTGLDGRFRFDDVGSTYDLTVAHGDLTLHLAELRRRNPVVPVGIGLTAFRSVDVSGVVTSEDGSLFPLGADQEVFLAPAGLEPGPQSMTAGDGTFASVGWCGPTEVRTRVVAVAVKRDTEGRLRFLATGRSDELALSSGTPFPDPLAIELGSDPVEVAETTFSVEPGVYSSSTQVGLASFRVSAATFKMDVPVFLTGDGEASFPADGARVYFQGYDTDGNEALVLEDVVFGGVTGLALPQQTTLQVVRPVTGASGVSQTPVVAWTPVANVTSYWVMLTGPSFHRSYFLPPSASTLTVEDFGELGRTLPAGERIDLEVWAIIGEGLDVETLTDGTGAGFGRIYFEPTIRRVFRSNGSFNTAP